MITLDPEFVGGFAPQSKLTEGIDPDALPFARQPRLNRLRIQRKADETEDTSEGESIVERPEDTSDMKRDSMRRERHKMRGKGKSIKRCVGNCSSVTAWVYMGLGQILAETKKKCHRPKSRELNSSCFIPPEVIAARLRCARHLLNNGLGQDQQQMINRDLASPPRWTGSTIDDGVCVGIHCSRQNPNRGLGRHPLHS